MLNGKMLRTFGHSFGDAQRCPAHESLCQPRGLVIVNPHFVEPCCMRTVIMISAHDEVLLS